MLFKYFIRISILLIISLNGLSCVVYLRPQNDRGPNAWSSGVQCLKRLKQVYFVNPMQSRTANIVLLHTANMSSPAFEIEKEFFIYINNFIMRKDENLFQIRVISDAKSVKDISISKNGLILADYYLFVADNFDKLISNIEKFVSLAATWNPLGKFLVLYNNPNDRLNAHEFSEKLFHAMYTKFYVTKIVLAFATGTTKYELYLNDPYSSEIICESSLSTYIGIFDKGQFETKKTKIQAILKKIENPLHKLNHCILNVCAKISPPFIEEGCSRGIELLVLKIVKNAMKFKINLSCSHMNRGELLPNGSFTGLLEKIKNHTCDLIVGGIFPDNEVHDSFGVSTPYLIDSYAWYVPIAAMRPLWKGLFTIFQTTTWFVFALIMLISGFAWFIFGFWLPETANHKKIVCCFFNTWAVFLGVSSNDRPEYTTLRIFFIALALYSLNTTTIYTSKLISVFTEPVREDQMNTVEEIIASGLNFGGLPEFRDWFDNDDEEDRYIYNNYNTTSRFKTSIENLQYIIKSEQVMLVNRLFVQTSGLYGYMFGLKENVFSNQLEMITGRSLSILPKINTVITSIKDFGLIMKIYNDFLFNYTVLGSIKETVQKNKENLNTRSEIVLTISHLQSAFVLWFYGLLLSLIVLIIEIIETKIRNKIKNKKLIKSI